MKGYIILTVSAALLMHTANAIDEDFMKETGGFVIRDDPGNGFVLIANTQTRLPEEKLLKPVSYMRFHAKMHIDFKTVDSALLKIPFAQSMKSLGATVVVFVKDSKDDHSSIIVSPDERWASVNVAALNVDDPGDEVLALRTRKAINRALCLVCGAGGSQYPNTLVGPFKNGVKDYDRFSNEGLPPDVFQRMQHYLKTLDVRPIVRTTYINACQQGWAHAPTNEYQRVIYERIKAEQSEKPTNPIKILPGQKPSGK